MASDFHQIRDHILRLHRIKGDPALKHFDLAQLGAMLSTEESPRPETLKNGGPRRRAERWQDALIEEELPEGASVLDLGCGHGELLARLIASKGIRAQGIELDPEAVAACVERGVAVFQADLDEGLRGFADRSFDYVILEETLPTLRRPIEVLEEMLRVGRFGIVSFPNFAHWRVRIDLAIQGRMPRTECLPDEWHETSNIRLFTIRDFIDWAVGNDVEILGGHVLADGGLRKLSEADNLFAEEALLIVAREGAIEREMKKLKLPRRGGS